MKNRFYIILFLLMSIPAFKVNSQTIMLNPEDSNLQKVIHIKTITSRYFNGKVYLHLTINGNTKNQIVAVERSLDATNYEVIGFIKIYGVNVPGDIAYYFTDKSPIKANLYYRLSIDPLNNGPVYSETMSVTPIDEYKAPTGIAPATPVCTDAASLVGAIN